MQIGSQILQCKHLGTERIFSLQTQKGAKLSENQWCKRQQAEADAEEGPPEYDEEFSVQVTEHSMIKGVVESPSLEIFKNSLDMIL